MTDAMFKPLTEQEKAAPAATSPRFRRPDNSSNLPHTWPGETGDARSPATREVLTQDDAISPWRRRRPFLPERFQGRRRSLRARSRPAGTSETSPDL